MNPNVVAKNPIAEKLIQLSNSRELVHKKCTCCGKQDCLGTFSWELVCVVSNLKMNTLLNLFRRPRVSKLVLTSLLMAGLITQEDIQKQELFIMSKGMPLEGRGGKRGARKKRIRYEDQPQEPSPEPQEAVQPEPPDPEGTV